MIRLYKKKAVDILALQWTGHNLDEVRSFLGGAFQGYYAQRHPGGKCDIKIGTLEDGDSGTVQVSHVASRDDYLIKGAKGEFFACKPDIFRLTYDLVWEEPKKGVK